MKEKALTHHVASSQDTKSPRSYYKSTNRAGSWGAVLSRPRDGEVPLVLPDADLIAEAVAGRQPVARLVLVVGVERLGIEHKRLAGVHVRGRVPLPQDSVDEAGLDTPRVALQRL